MTHQQLDARNLARVGLTATAVTTVLQGVTAAAALRNGRRDLADVVWGPGLAAIAVGSAVTGNGDPWRRWSLAAAATGWGLRLGRLISRRVRDSDEEDPRYTEYLEGDSNATVVGKVFLTQGLAQLLVSAPLQVAAASTLPPSGRRLVFPLGLAAMIAGAVTEATADRQKSAYMARDRDERPAVLDTGLWGWSRHPNYFGDACVWAGAWLASAASRGSAWTLPSPVAMAYLLVFATGARRTERRMQEREAYRDYQQRVSFFVPLPPKG